MSSFYTDIGTGIYTLFSGIDITPAAATGWAETYNRPPKQLQQYPSFAVMPASDVEDNLDNQTDTFTSTWWVYLYVSYEQAAASEAQLRRLVDLCWSTLRKQKQSGTPFSGSADFLGLVKGTWGGNAEEGLRFYRFTMEIHASASTT